MTIAVDDKVLGMAPLFEGTTTKEAHEMLGCLGAVTKKFSKGEIIYRMGEKVTSVGMVLKGRVQTESVDVWGNVSVLSQVEPGFIFAESVAAAPDQPLMYNVVAMEDTEVMFLKVARILTTCSNNCIHHQRVVRNMMGVLARKNAGLSQRISITAPKTIRGKLLSYLSLEAEKQGKTEFDIPFNRQQLADYLGVDRSAMSAELSRMQTEGMLETRRSHFVLKDIDD